MSQRVDRRFACGWGIGAALMASALGGCASAPGTDLQARNATFVADHVPTWASGEPANAPARPANPPAYPNVFKNQPTRATKLLTYDEEKHLEAALVAARKGTDARLQAAADADRKAAASNAAAIDRATVADHKAAALARLAEDRALATTSN